MILVLPREAPEALVDAVVREAEALGWRTEVSTGEEQTVVALSGPGDPEALEDAMRRRSEVDVIALVDPRELRSLRQRRRLLAGLAGGLGAIAAAGTGIPLAGFLLPPKGALSDRSLVPAGSLDDLRESEARRVNVLGRPVLLVRLEEDRLYALSAVCTHMEICTLEWSAERRELVCPCHGGAFDVRGNVLQGPPSVPLSSYPVERVGSDLFIRREV